MEKWCLIVLNFGRYAGLSKNNWVFISEYKAPSDFVCLSKVSKMVGFVGATDRTRIENCSFIKVVMKSLND